MSTRTLIVICFLTFTLELLFCGGCANNHEVDKDAEGNAYREHIDKPHYRVQFKNRRGSIFSPGYPAQLTPFTAEWVIQARKGENIKLQIDFFNQSPEDNDICLTFLKETHISHKDYDSVLSFNCTGSIYTADNQEVSIKIDSSDFKYRNAFSISYEAVASKDYPLAKTINRRKRQPEDIYEGIAIGNPLPSTGNDEFLPVFAYLYSSSRKRKKSGDDRHDVISLKDDYVNREEVITFLKELQANLSNSNEEEGRRNQETEYMSLSARIGEYVTASQIDLLTSTSSDRVHILSTNYNRNSYEYKMYLPHSLLMFGKEKLASLEEFTNETIELEEELLEKQQDLLQLSNDKNYIRNASDFIRINSVYILNLQNSRSFLFNPPSNIHLCDEQLDPVYPQVFSSPFFPGAMPPFINCTWNIAKFPESLVVINFLYFSLGNGIDNNCLNSPLITIWQDSMTKDSVLCGYKHPFTYIGRAERITFTSENQISRGFLAVISYAPNYVSEETQFANPEFKRTEKKVAEIVIHNPSTMEEYFKCERKMIDPIGFISPPYNFGPLPAFFLCQWHIEVEQHQKILLEFSILSIGDNKTDNVCTTGQLVIMELGLTPTVLCGEYSTYSLLSESNSMILSLSTFSSKTSTGFAAHYLAVPGYVTIENLPITSLKEFFNSLIDVVDFYHDYLITDIYQEILTTDTETFSDPTLRKQAIQSSNDAIPGTERNETVDTVSAHGPSTVITESYNNECYLEMSGSSAYLSSRFLSLSDEVCILSIAPEIPFQTIVVHLSVIMMNGSRQDGKCTTLSSYVKISFSQNEQLFHKVICENELGQYSVYSTGTVTLEIRLSHWQDEFDLMYKAQNSESPLLPDSLQTKMQMPAKNIDPINEHEVGQTKWIQYLSDMYSDMNYETYIQNSTKFILDTLYINVMEYLEVLKNISAEVDEAKQEFVWFLRKLNEVPEHKYIERAVKLARDFSLPFNTIHTFISHILRSPSHYRDFEKCEESLAPIFMDIFSSPFYPGMLPPNTICTWNIQSDPESYIIITFLNFSLGVDVMVDCNDKARLIIFDKDSNYVITFCGRKSPFSYIGESFRLVLNTENDVVHGFLGFLSSVPKFLVTPQTHEYFPASNDDSYSVSQEFKNNPNSIHHYQNCERDTFGPVGFIASPYFPGPIPPYFECKWNIQAPEKHLVMIEFPFLDVGEDDNGNGCTSGKLVIQSESSYEEFCGKYDPFTFISDSPSVALVVMTMSSTNSSGFLAHFVKFPDSAEISFLQIVSLNEYIQNATSHFADLFNSINMNYKNKSESFKSMLNNFDSLGYSVANEARRFLQDDVEINSEHFNMLDNSDALDNFDVQFIEKDGFWTTEKSGLHRPISSFRQRPPHKDPKLDTNISEISIQTGYSNSEIQFILTDVSLLSQDSRSESEQILDSDEEGPIEEIEWVSTDSMRLSKKSSSSDKQTSFGRNLYSSRKNSQPVHCGGILYEKTGFIHTPEYPGMYPADTICFWSILSTDKNGIRLKFHSFDVDGPVSVTGACRSELSPRETYSHLRVSYYNQRGRVVTNTYCGSDRPHTITSFSNRLSMYFKSGQGLGYGFRAEYFTYPSGYQGRLLETLSDKETCTYQVTELAGYMTLKDDMEYLSENCTWFIDLKLTNVLYLYVKSMAYSAHHIEPQDCTSENAALSIKTNGSFTWNFCRNISSETFILTGGSVILLNLNAQVEEFIAIYNTTDYGLKEFVKNQIGDLSPDQTNVEQNTHPLFPTFHNPYTHIDTLPDYSITQNSKLEDHTCDLILDSRNGVILFPTSDDTQLSYCSWTIPVHENERVGVTFTSFSFGPEPKGNGCDPELPHLKIESTSRESGSISTLHTFCGDNIPKTLTLDGGEVLITPEGSSKGRFSLTFRKVSQVGGRVLNISNMFDSLFDSLSTESLITSTETKGSVQPSSPVANIKLNQLTGLDSQTTITSSESEDDFNSDSQALSTATMGTVKPSPPMGKGTSVGTENRLGQRNKIEPMQSSSKQTQTVSRNRYTDNEALYTEIVFSTFVEDEMVTYVPDSTDQTNQQDENRNGRILIKYVGENDTNLTDNHERQDTIENEDEDVTTEVLAVFTTLLERDTRRDYRQNLTLYVTIGVSLALVVFFIGLAWYCVRNNRRNVSVVLA